MAAAQDEPSVSAPPETAASWEAATRAEFDRLSDGREGWQLWVLSLKRNMESGTIMGRLEQQSRFGVSDVGGRVDVWHDLWSGAWGHLQLGVGPDATIYPRGTVQVDVTQSIGAWEVTGQYTWRTYESDRTHAARLQAAYYIGNWYLRGFATAVPQRGDLAAAGGVGARRFLAGSQSYLDVEAGAGRGVEFVGPDSELLVERTAFVSARVQHFFSRRLGFMVNLRYSDDGFFERTGGSVGLMVRW